MTGTRALEGGVVLRCDGFGRIQSVLREEMGLGGRLASGALLPDVFDPGSAEKARALLAEIRDRGVACDWELNLAREDEICLLHVSGTREGPDSLLIVALASPSELEACLDELARINNEHANALRDAMRSIAEGGRAQARRDDQFEQMTRLNSDLATVQRQLSRKNAELSRINEQKNQLLGMAAHDLRNPLGVIQTYSRFLLDEAAGGLEKEHAEFLEAIHASAEFMLHMVEDLLDVSRIGAGKLDLARHPTDLVELTKRVVVLNRVLVQKKGIDLRFAPARTVLELSLDAYKIEQVLNNLLTNAAKFSPPGSPVEVRVSVESPFAIIAVADQGPGIPKEELGRLFRPFGRTSVQSTAGEKSTGLGLAIARRIVEGHGGRIWVESEVGRGSTFRVALPMADPVDVSREPAPAMPKPCPSEAGGAALAAAFPGGPLRILVADDEAVSRALTKRVLERAGHHVTVVGGGEEAVAKVDQGGFDALVLDLEMPGMGGLEAARTIRRAESRRPAEHIAILMLSGHDPAEVGASCLEAGAGACLRKPVSPKDLLAQIETLALPVRDSGASAR